MNAEEGNAERGTAEGRIAEVRKAWHTMRPCVVLLVALLGGCSTSPPSHFYTLTGSGTTAGVPPTDVVGTFSTPIAVGPVSLPEAVNRPQFVVTDGGNRVVVIETRRWAEPLKSGIAEAVAGDLTSLLGGARVTTMTQSASNDAGVYVALDVQRFDMTVGESIALDVVWTIRRRGEAQAVGGRSSVRESARATDDPYDALVEAQVRAIAQVSRDIAAKLVALPVN